MKKLINIGGQQYYYATVSELLSDCSEKCAVIINEDLLKELIDKGIENIESYVNQIIVISENVNTALTPLIGIDVFLMAASSTEQAIRFGTQSSALNNSVVCVLPDEAAITQILETMEG
jgi:hypothetical protein